MKCPLTLSILVVFLLAPAIAAGFTLTQWQQDGTAVSSAPGNQMGPKCISDEAGGVFVVWHDDNNMGTSYWDIRIRRVSSHGIMLWGTDGVVVCDAANNQLNPTLVFDGSGGVIVTWSDERSGGADIYAQRINASGVAQWTTNGVPVCTAANQQINQVIASDGAGGAIIAWVDLRSGGADIYAQRVDASGVAQWTANGVAVCALASDQDMAAIVSDGAGGAIVAWADGRNTVDSDIYAQRLDATGVVQWTVNGVPLSTAANYQLYPKLVADGVGGANVVWIDYNGLGSNNVWAQNVDAWGTVHWGANGIAVALSLNDQSNAEIASDGAGGAIVVWDDFRNGIDTNVYAQRISGAGAAQWTGDGVIICGAWNDQGAPQIVADGAGGAVVTWQDQRNDFGDIYAQRIDGAGKVRWNADGEAVCNAANSQVLPTIAADGAGGAIIAWGDVRTFVGDVYAQRVDLRYGYWGHPEPLLASVVDVPADQGGKVRVNWSASGRDSINEQIISHYSIWRAADAAAAASAMQAGVPRKGLPDVGKVFYGPAIREEQTAAGTLFWELVGTQDAIYRTAYAFTASTGYDSSAAAPAVQQFQVVAHAYYSQYINWPSNVVSGYSVDNLAPAAPLYLSAQRVGADVHLMWNRVRVADLRDYAVYRATSSGVTPVPANFLSSSTDSTLTDAGAPLTTLYYVVTAYDLHANQSAASNQAVVSNTTGVGDTPAITRLTLLQNSPNPFTAQTDFQVGLPAPSDVTVEVYDVTGRRVSVLEVKQAGAGWQRIPFTGRDERGAALVSGVYFYRVTANGSSVTRKMVIAR